MEGDRIARCSYRSLTVVIAVHEHSKYVDICDEICSRFKQLDVGSFELTYSLPDHPNCLLQSDLDVRMMWMSLTVLNSSFVDIMVKDCVNSNIEGDGQNHEESPHTMSNNDVPNHMTPVSCTLESHSAIGENENMGTSTSHEDNAYLCQVWKENISHVGQRFEGGATEFREKLCQYAAEMGFNFAYVKNCTDRVTAECKKKSDGCKWYVHATIWQVNGFFYIRKLNNVHTCMSGICRQKSKMSTKIISTLISDQIKENPAIKVRDIIKDIKEKYGFDIPYHDAYRGKIIAKSTVHGDESFSYGHLVRYREALASANPESHCVLECDPETFRFRRLFVCFGACIEGFHWCRPLLFIDDIFLKTKYGGQLIGATGKDGNQGFFPFAFAIMNAESDENWSWFFENLAKVLGRDGRTITFVSDHKKGLIEVVSNIFPTSHHAFSMHLLKQNLVSIYNSANAKFLQERIVRLFMQCAYAPTEVAFEFNMQNLKDEGAAPMRTFLENLPKEHWSYAYFKGTRYGEICNAVSGSFTSWVLNLWDLPICQMVDGIRMKLMETIAERNHEAEQWCSVLCPEMERTLNNTLMVGKNWYVNRSSASSFEVLAEGYVTTYTVDLDNTYCSCHEWQIKGFPCAHALVAVQKNSGSVYDFVPDYFKSSHFRSSYAMPIFPIPDLNSVLRMSRGDIMILPPVSTKSKAPVLLPPPVSTESEGPRPKKRKATTCGRCGAVGQHNRKTCPASAGPEI